MIYASTFSKTIAPGLRIGWLVLPGALFNPTLILKQASDLHTSSFDQRVAHTFLTQNDQTIHLEKIRRAYGERYEVLDAALRADMPARLAHAVAEPVPQATVGALHDTPHAPAMHRSPVAHPRPRAR